MPVLQHNAITDLTFTLFNDGPPEAPAIFLDDPALDRLTLTLYNNSTEAILLPGVGGASPAAEVQFFFRGLLGADEIRAVTVQAPAGWQGTVRETGDGPYLSFSVASDTSITSHSQVRFALANVRSASVEAASGEVRMNLRNIRGLDVSSYTAPLFLVNKADVQASAATPVSTSAVAPLNFCVVGENVIRISPSTAAVVTNRVVFAVHNPSGQALAPGGAATWGSGPTAPRFTISFALGTGPGHLTRKYFPNAPAAAVDSPYRITLTEDENYGARFDYPTGGRGVATGDPVQGQEVEWEILPRRIENPRILDAGQTIQFACSEIVTLLDEGVTPVYLRYYNLPGYADGVRAVYLEKKAADAVLSFRNESAGPVQTGQAIELSWNTHGVNYCTLTTEAAVVLRDNSAARLDFGRKLNAQASRFVVRPELPLFTPVGDLNLDLMLSAIGPGGVTRRRISVPMAVLPVSIQSFTSSTAVVSRGDTIRLSWNTASAMTCELHPQIGVVAASGTRDVVVLETTEFELVCQGNGGPVRATVRVTVEVNPILLERMRRQEEANYRIQSQQAAARTAGKLVMPYYIGQAYTNDHNALVRQANPWTNATLNFNIPWDYWYSNPDNFMSLYPHTQAERQDYYRYLYGRICKQSIPAGDLVDPGTQVVLNYMSD